MEAFLTGSWDQHEEGKVQHGKYLRCGWKAPLEGHDDIQLSSGTQGGCMPMCMLVHPTALKHGHSFPVTDLNKGVNTTM